MSRKPGRPSVRIALRTAVLLCALAPCAGLMAGQSGDRVPRDLGFSGSFSHNADDSFEFDFSRGDRLVVDRQGGVEDLEAAEAQVRRDKDGRPLSARDARGMRYKFVYNQSGQLVGVISREDGSFRIAYSGDKNLRSIEFPSRARGSFPLGKRR
jgi:YD repeat-containing protein